VELPDTGRYGFLLPPSQIHTVGAELWAATGLPRRLLDTLPTGADPARDLEKKADIKLGLAL